MKKFFVLMLLISPFLLSGLAFAEDEKVFDSTNSYTGACQQTDKSEWQLTRDLKVSMFRIWYSWNTGETTLPVTVYKDGKEFAKFDAQRGNCDPYQQQWCNADYAINKDFPKGNYSTAIPNARQCLKPGGTGTVLLYGTEGVAEVTNPDSCKSCTGTTIIVAIISLAVGFGASNFAFKKRSTN
ncbi:MAG: hypothetical protein PHG69_05935 [Candidatus Omnitrophica bacterium]|nr:hypothetical protein [Candidatus Omnitrophota bacterium]